MSMLPVVAPATPEPAASTNPPANPGGSGASSGFAQILSQHTQAPVAKDNHSALTGPNKTSDQSSPGESVQRPAAGTDTAGKKPAARSSAAGTPNTGPLLVRDKAALAAQQSELLVGVPPPAATSTAPGAIAPILSTQELTPRANQQGEKKGKQSSTAEPVTSVLGFLPAYPSQGAGIAAEKGVVGHSDKSLPSRQLLRDAGTLQMPDPHPGHAATAELPVQITLPQSSFRSLLATEAGSPGQGQNLEKIKLADPGTNLVSGASPLLSLVQMPQSNQQGAAPAQLQLTPALQEQPAWGQALGQGLQWMSQGGVQQAILHIHPEHLGPLVVQLGVSQNGQASAVFLSAHPEVREAIAAAVPQLQQSFAAMGLQLGQASVGSGSSGWTGSRRNEPQSGKIEETLAEGITSLPSATVHQGLLSTFV